MQSCVAVCPVNTQPKCNTAVKDFEEKKELSYCFMYLLRRGRVRIGFFVQYIYYREDESGSVFVLYLLRGGRIRIGFCSVYLL